MNLKKEKKKINNELFKKNNSKLYATNEWKQLRFQKLNLNPWCEKCNSTSDLHIDHIFEHEENELLFYDLNNLMTLCRTCHFSKTMKDKELAKYPINKNFIIYLTKKEWVEVGYLKCVYKTDLKSILGHLIKKIESWKFPKTEYKSFDINIGSFSIYEFKMLLDMLVERYKCNVYQWYISTKSTTENKNRKPVKKIEVIKWALKIQNEKME